MSDDNETSPVQSDRIRYRITQVVGLVFVALLVVVVVVQLTLNSSKNRIARAGRTLDAMAARQPDAGTAGRELAEDPNLQIWTFVGYGPLDDGWELRLRYSRLDQFRWWLAIKTELNVGPGVPPVLGEIRFREGHFVSCRNDVTGTNVKTDQTTVPK